MDDPQNMDCSWEFNAPQFVDFSTANDDDEHVDRWFDVDHENGETEVENICNGVDVIEDAEEEIEKLEGTPKQEARRLTRSMCLTPVNDKGLPVATAEPSKQEAQENGKNGRLNESLPLNLCKSMSDWKKRTKAKITPQETAAKRRSPPQLKKPVQEAKQKAVKRHNRSLEGNQKNEVEVKKLRRSAGNMDNGKIKRTGSFSRLPVTNGKQVIGKAANSSLNTSTGAKRGPQRTRSVSSIPIPHSPRTSGNIDKKNTDSRAKLTMPSTPTCLKRNPVIKSALVKNTEEKQLETIAQFRHKLSKQLKQNQESFKKAVVAPSYVPAHSKTKPTQPHEFKFKTDDRIKNQPVEANATSPVDYVRTLRSETNKTSNVKGITCPKPFNLTESRKRKISQSTEALNDSYHSTAEKLIAFEKQTPDRFKTKPREPVAKRGKQPSGMTVPVTPQLETRSRLRPQHIPSQKDVEEQEIEEMKKNQFKAHPVNTKILQNPATGVRKVPSKPPTQVEEFNLEGLKRNQNKSQDNTEEKYEFHAQPVPKEILEGPVGLKPARVKPVTVPHSPAFALKHRVRMPIEVPEEPEDNKSYSRRKVPHSGIPFQPALSHKSTVPAPFGFSERDRLRMAQKAAKVEQVIHEEKMEELFKSNPVPYVGVPFQPKLKHKRTVPKPFTFQDRDKEMVHRKEQKIAEIFEEERQAREFRANPLPSPTADNLPTKHVKPPTEPEPFRLDTDCRMNRSEERKKQIEEELNPKIQFKARPAGVLRKKAFEPEKSTKPLTDISEFSLNTEKRACNREDFEMHKKMKEAEIEAVKRRIEREKEEEEQRAIARLRAEMVHKSNPVKKFTNVEVHPSDKPITYAVSPKFETDRRLRNKVRV